jgi:hypothetical protein
MADQNETARSWATEAGKAAFGGAAGGTVFGIVGALLYDNAGAATLSCTSVINQRYDGTAYNILVGTPVGCAKVVVLPVFGTASSLTEAAATYGLVAAVLVFLGACLYLAVFAKRSAKP